VNLPDGEQAISNQLGVKKPGVNKPEGKTTKGRKSHNSAVDDVCLSNLYNPGTICK